MKWNNEAKKWTVTTKEYNKMINDLNNTKNRQIKRELKEMMERVEVR